MLTSLWISMLCMTEHETWSDTLDVDLVKMKSDQESLLQVQSCIIMHFLTLTWKFKWRKNIFKLCWKSTFYYFFFKIKNLRVAVKATKSVLRPVYLFLPDITVSVATIISFSSCFPELSDIMACTDRYRQVTAHFLHTGIQRRIFFIFLVFYFSVFPHITYMYSITVVKLLQCICIV